MAQLTMPSSWVYHLTTLVYFLSFWPIIYFLNFWQLYGYAIHSFKVYNSMAFYIQYTLNCAIITTVNFKTFSSPLKRNSTFLSHPLQSPIPPSLQFSSVAQSCPTLCNPMNYSITRPLCPSPSPGVHSNSHPSSWWCHPAISSSVVPFSSCPQSLPASESFPMSQLFPWGDQSTGISALASFLPKNTQGWSPLAWTRWISL